VEYIDVLFDGPPSPDTRLVEVEGPSKASVKAGEWVDRGEGFWALRIRPSDISRIDDKLLTAAPALLEMCKRIASRLPDRGSARDLRLEEQDLQDLKALLASLSGGSQA